MPPIVTFPNNRLPLNDTSLQEEKSHLTDYLLFIYWHKNWNLRNQFLRIIVYPMKKPIAKMLFIRATLLLVLFPLLSIAADPNDATSNKLFSQSAPIELILQMDMQKVLNDKSEDPEYIPAFLIQKLGDNKIQSFNITIKARGKTRRIHSICEFPPLKINFKKKSIVNTIFEGQDKIKMVTHCQESESFQNFALLEYLAYQTYNTITDYSYKVRMVNVTYKDIKQNYPDIEKTGFLIEDDDLLAERLGGTISDKKIWSPDSCIQSSVDIFSLFQFMIGNTDWWIHTRHNVDIVNLNGDKLIPIPFDFDYAGLINTPYATPSSNLPIANVKDRFLKGSCYYLKGTYSCKTMNYYEDVIQVFNMKKSAIISVLEGADYLNKRDKKTSLKYVAEFYDIINNPNKFSKYLNASCDFTKNPTNRGFAKK